MKKLKTKLQRSETQVNVEKMFFALFNPDTGVKYVYIKEDDTLYATEDGTPETTHLSFSQNETGMHIYLHHGSWNREEWEEYVIRRNQVFLNSWKTEVTVEELQDKLMDVYNENFKKS